ncbi:hypothetical protein [Phenylobacterium soli]|uniref:hypothetical protein n=1 Tax=Phenylobacterium soli TaxID=2170551 RepID=UPI001401D811|nr:hypothetical protein [Phenylobacterium soli]
MTLLETLDALEKSGASKEVILAVVRAYAEADDVRLEARRAKDAARQRAKRSRGVTRCHADTDGHGVTSADTAPRDAHVEDTSSSSLRSEEEDTPKKPTVSAPKGAARSKSNNRRSRFVPDDWNPTDADMAYAANLGFTPGEIERELAKFRRYEFARPYSHWSRTLQSWLDRAAERKPRKAHERPDDKFARRQANHARAFAASERAAGPGWEP